MQPELEITNKDFDVLNRNDFASRLADNIINYNHKEPLTIGIMGSWGSGKSSLINLTANILKKEKVIIIRFDPWYFSNQDNLYLQFFKLLISTLRTEEKNKNIFKRKITPKRNLFEKQNNSLKNYFNYIKDSSLKFDIDNLEFNESLESYDSLNYHKEQCEEYIKKFNCKIIMIIDDMDRLTNIEIAQIFTLVRSLADFENFIYILSFDKIIVTEALKTVNPEYKDDFIDKIINIPINIPKINESKMDELISTNIKPIYDNQIGKNFINYNNEFENILSYLKLFIKDIRDLKRYRNLLNFYLNNIIDDLNIDDFFLILAIQLFNYKLFLKIKDKPSQLINDSVFKDNNAATLINMTRFNESFKKSIGLKEWEKYQEMLIYLFPLLEDRLNPITKTEYEKWVDEHKICCEKYFEKYFTMSLENNEVADSLIDLLIKKTDEKEIHDFFTKRNNPDYNHSLLFKFSNKLSEIPNKNSELFIKALMKCGDEMNLYLTSRDYFPQILKKLFEKIESEKYFELLEEFIDYPNNVFTVSEFVYSIGNDTNIQKDERKLNKIKKLTVIKIKKSSENRDFLDMKFLQKMLFYWKQLDNENDVKQYVLNNVKSNDEILSFLAKFRTKSDPQFYIIGGGSNAHLLLDLDELNTYHSLESYAKIVNRKLIEPDISEDIIELCEIFLKQYEEYKLNKYITG